MKMSSKNARNAYEESRHAHDLQKTIDRGDWTAEQVFNVDEIALFWKQMLSCMFISEKGDKRART